MPLLTRRSKHETDPKVAKARLQVDLAVLKMSELLDRVEEQVGQAKEDLSEVKNSLEDEGGGK